MPVAGDNTCLDVDKCRERNRDKEIHGQMKFGAKSQSSYERIKKDLQRRGAIPLGNKHQ